MNNNALLALISDLYSQLIEAHEHIAALQEELNEESAASGESGSDGAVPQNIRRVDPPAHR